MSSNNILDSCGFLHGFIFYTFLSPSPLTFHHSPQLPLFIPVLSPFIPSFPSPSTHSPPCLRGRLSALALSKLADFQTQTRAGLEHALNVRKVCKGNRCVVHTPTAQECLRHHHCLTDSHANSINTSPHSVVVVSVSNRI